MNWNWEAVWSVLRWILLTLAVGFVGQFGRSLATSILQKKRAARMEQKQNGPLPPDVQIEQAHAEAQAKIEKKRAKAEVKRKKKTAKTDSQDE